MASRWAAPRRRPVILLGVLVALCFHRIAVCSAASPATVPQKPRLAGRKAVLAPLEERTKPSKAAATVMKAKKKVVATPAPAAKDQTSLLKQGKKASSVAASTGKIATTKTPAAAAAAVTVKSKIQKLGKAASVKDKSSDNVKLGKLAKIATMKAEVTTKRKKPSDSKIVDAVKPAKSSKKAQGAPEIKATKKAAAAVATALAEEDRAEDLISEFRELPARLQETLVPDLALLSSASRAYLSAANAGIADGVRPLLGGRWAPVAATVASAAALLLPLCLLAALVRRVGAYLPLLRRALLLAQAYLAIYFATLAVASAATGLEPLRFFHAASPAAYAWTQAAQSLGYVVYLVLQVVDLVAAFSAEHGGGRGGGGSAAESARALSLAQMVVGLAVGLHYYAAVFHRAAAGKAPRANWRVHAVYAACFVVVCACARAERRKKAYLAGAAAAAEEAWKKS